MKKVTSLFGMLILLTFCSSFTSPKQQKGLNNVTDVVLYYSQIEGLLTDLTEKGNIQDQILNYSDVQTREEFLGLRPVANWFLGVPLDVELCPGSGTNCTLGDDLEAISPAMVAAGAGNMTKGRGRNDIAWVYSWGTI